MTFEMVRIGWPNTATIVALAIMPIVALTTATDRRPSAVQVEPATICQTLAECTAIAAAAAPDTVLE